MICPVCAGTRRQWSYPLGPWKPPVAAPCPECGGSGIVHCCEGLQEQLGSGQPQEIEK